MTIIRMPELLAIQEKTRVAWGSNQAWYPTAWQKEAGCGPATCANLMWYLAKTRPALQPLCPGTSHTQQGMLELMREMWLYITPNAMGVDNLSHFSAGAIQFARDKKISLKAECLEIPPANLPGPSYTHVVSFLTEAFSNDYLVAFLNLANGNVPQLESWHWVTLFSLEYSGCLAGMLDQGRRLEIDLSTWFARTKLGGGFVVLKTL